MIVQTIEIENKKRFILLDDDGVMNVPVSKYLKHLDNVGRSTNTLRTYCHALKLYFEYLSSIKKEYNTISFQDLSDFVGWLKTPMNQSKIVELYPKNSSTRSNKTINLITNIVMAFYDYLYREEMMGEKITDVLYKKAFNGEKAQYKSFLSHIQNEKEAVKSVLKLKTTKQKAKTLSKEEVKKVFDACSNNRDRFLIQLLYETGCRIGEALSLHIEDFEIDPIDGHKIHLVDRGDLENGAALKTGERTLNVSEALMEMFDDYLLEILDDLESDYVFVKLSGENKGKPLAYEDVNALMKRLRKKTNIDVTAHMFRHTHATQFYQKTKNIKATQDRLGHAGIQTTMNMYIHTSDDEKQKEWESVQDSFGLKNMLVDEGEQV